MRRRSAGVNLMEVVVSTNILAVVVLLTFNLFPGSFLALESCRTRSEAHAAAVSLLEERSALPYAAHQLGEEKVAEGLTLTVAPAPGAATDRLLELQATASWTDFSGSHRLTQSCYVVNLER